MSALTTTSILSWRLGSGFLDLFHFVYKSVCCMDQLFTLCTIRRNIRFAPV
jgi:hypothetical protein